MESGAKLRILQHEEATVNEHARITADCHTNHSAMEQCHKVGNALLTAYEQSPAQNAERHGSSAQFPIQQLITEEQLQIQEADVADLLGPYRTASAQRRLASPSRPPPAPAAKFALVIVVKEGHKLSASPEALNNAFIRLTVDGLVQGRTYQSFPSPANRRIVWGDRFVLPRGEMDRTCRMEVALLDNNSILGTGYWEAPPNTPGPYDVWIPLQLESVPVGEILLGVQYFQGQALNGNELGAGHPGQQQQPSHDQSAHSRLYAQTDPAAVRQLLRQMLQPATTVARGEGIVQDLKRQIPPSGPLSTGLQALPDIAHLLHQVIHDTDCLARLEEGLVRTEPRLREVLQRVEGVEAHRDATLREGELVQTELLHDEAINLLQEALDVVMHRLGLLHDVGHERRIARLGELEERAVRIIEPIRQMLAALRDSVNGDQGRLARRKDGERQRLQDTAAQHEAKRRSTHLRLNENEKRQEGVWSQIQQLFGELQGLGAERWEEVKRWTQEEENMIAAQHQCAAVNRAIEEQQAALRDLEAHLQSLEGMVQAYDQFTNTVGSKVRSAHATMSEYVAAMKHQEQKRHYEVVRRYFASLADLLTKKQTRAEEIDRFTLHLDHQIDAASRTLDPGLARYHTMKTDLARERAHVMQKIETLKQNAAKAVADFQPTEQALAHQGQDVLSPVVESTESNLPRLNTSIQARRSVIDADKLQAEAAAQSLDALISSTKQARQEKKPAIVAHSPKWRANKADGSPIAFHKVSSYQPGTAPPPIALHSPQQHQIQMSPSWH